jgi:hypothetical protein
MNKIIGVLWKREKDGKEYFSGVLNDLRGKINIAVFPNTWKEADNQPDMNIVISWSDFKSENLYEIFIFNLLTGKHIREKTSYLNNSSFNISKPIPSYIFPNSKSLPIMLIWFILSKYCSATCRSSKKSISIWL